MSYGFRARNAAGDLIIDGDNVNYSLALEGSFTATNAEWIRVTFPSPITSPDVPLVAFQHWGSDGFAIRHVRLVGAPGAWVGFDVLPLMYIEFYDPLPARSINYRVFATDLIPTEDYGLRVKSETGRIVFDSSLRMLTFRDVLTSNPGDWQEFYSLRVDATRIVKMFYNHMVTVAPNDWVLISMHEGTIYGTWTGSYTGGIPATLFYDALFFTPDGRVALMTDAMLMANGATLANVTFHSVVSIPVLSG